jgi:hypothetical protein
LTEMSKEELVAEAQRRQVDSTGNKPELLKRLQDAEG